MTRRLGLVAVTVGLVLTPSAAFAAAPAPVPSAAPTAQPEQPGVIDGIRDGVTSVLPQPGDVGEGILGTLGCDTQQAPAPAIPDGTPRAEVTIGGGVGSLPDFDDLGPGEVDGLLATYGYSPLRWFAYDATCINPTRVATDLASSSNLGVSTVDSLVTGAMVWASDEDTIGMDRTAAQAVAGNLRDTLFWPLLGVAFLGLLVASVSLLQQGALGAIAQLGAAAALVGGLTLALAQNPYAIVDLSRLVAGGVTEGVTTVLIEDTGRPIDGLAGDQVPAEAYYRATSYQAWLNGNFCGDGRAADAYGERFLEAQGYTAAEWNQVQSGALSEPDLAESKAERFVAAADDLESEYPGAFACWSGEGNNRGGALIGHLAVTLLLGPIALVAALATKFAEAAGLVIGFMWIPLSVVALFSARLRSGILTLLAGATAAVPVLAVLTGIAFGAVAGLGAAVPTVSALWPVLLNGIIFLAVVIFLAPKFLRLFGRSVEFSGARRLGRAGRRSAALAGRMAAPAEGGGTAGVAGLVGAGGVVGAVAGVAASRLATRRSAAPSDVGADDKAPRASEPAPESQAPRGPRYQPGVNLPAPEGPRYTEEEQWTTPGSPEAPGTTPPPAEAETTSAPAPSGHPSGRATSHDPAPAGATTSTPPDARPSSDVPPSTDREAEMTTRTPIAHETLARYRAQVPADQRVAPVADSAPRPIVDSEVARRVATAGRHVDTEAR